MNNLGKATLEIPMKSIYVVEKESGGVKIGVSQGVEGRIKTLSSQGGFKVKNLFHTQPCSNAYAIENSLHKYFCSKRIDGEWFDVDYELAKEITSIKFEEMSNQIPEMAKIITLEEIESKFTNNIHKYEEDELRETESSIPEGVAMLIDVLSNLMKAQGSTPYDIVRNAQLICEQYGIKLIDNFAKVPEYQQVALADMIRG